MCSGEGHLPPPPVQPEKAPVYWHGRQPLKSLCKLLENIKDLTWGSIRFDPPARRRSGAHLQSVLEHAVPVETVSNRKKSKKPDAATYHRFYAPVKIGESLYTLRIVAAETSDEDQGQA
ncbi:hypothetical protein [Sneathiella sp.]|uniref:LPD3 domain-containing protein n=1 Tax=Sneathiella sp. TaxID=1964365 RepID=UPI003FA6A447